MNDNKKPLYIPVNTPDYDAIISGIGTPELIIFAGATIAVIVFGLLLAQFTSILFAILLGLMVIGFVLVSFRKDLYNENFYKKISVICKFVKSQKVYRYEYFNIYEIPLKGEVVKRG